MDKAAPLPARLIHGLAPLLIVASLVAPAVLKLAEKRPPRQEQVVEDRPELPFPGDSPAAADGLADTDGEGMPDEWELRYGLDPADPADRDSDFDGDGVTALEEYQHGMNPLGTWKSRVIEAPAALAGWDMLPAGMNQYGEILVNFALASSDGDDQSRALIYHPDSAAWTEFVPYLLDAHFVVGQQINDQGAVLFNERDQNFCYHGRLLKPDGQIRSLLDAQGGVLVGVRMNDFADWVAFRPSDRAAASCIAGSLIIGAHSGWAGCEYCDINNSGEVLGTYTDSTGADLAFMERGDQTFETGVPSAYPFFDPGTQVWNSPSVLADGGDFAGLATQALAVSPWRDGRTYLYDGKYRTFSIGGNRLNEYPIGIDDSGRVLTSSALCSGGVAVSVGRLGDPLHPVSLRAAGLNRQGQILAYQPGGHSLVVLTPDDDQDRDGMPDDWETLYGLDKTSAADAAGDLDGDGICNLTEYRLGRNPALSEGAAAAVPAPDLRAGVDSDGDGIPDTWEWQHNLNPLNAADAAADPDGDGFTNWQEYRLGTDPRALLSWQLCEVAPAAGDLVFTPSLLTDSGTFLFGTQPAGQSAAAPSFWTLDPRATTGVQAALAIPDAGPCRPVAFSRSGAALGFSADAGAWLWYASPSARPVAIPDPGTRSVLAGSCWVSTSGAWAAGWRTTDASGALRPFVMALATGGSVPKALVVPAGVTLSAGDRLYVNDAGEVAATGHAALESALFWPLQPGSSRLAETLPLPAGGSHASVSGLSDTSPAWITGSGDSALSGSRALVWSGDGSGSAVEDLGALLGDSTSAAGGISSGGIIAAWSKSDLVDDAYQIFLIQRRDASWVPKSQGGSATPPVFRAVNDKGELLGECSSFPDESPIPRLWTLGLSLPLDHLLDRYPEYVPADVTDLNSSGMVVVSATRHGKPVRLILSSGRDSDGDGIPDSYESRYHLNPLSAADRDQDRDGDGITNLAEYLAGSDPTDFYNGDLPQLRLISDQPYAEPGTSSRLVFELRRGGAPLANGPVRFTLPVAYSGPGPFSLTADDAGQPVLTTRTGADGRLTVFVRRGPSLAPVYGQAAAGSEVAGSSKVAINAFTEIRNIFPAGTLGREATDEIDSRIANREAAPALPLFSLQDHATASYVRNTGCWAADMARRLTCISPWNSFEGPLRAGVAITPRHVLNAAHFDLFTGNVIRFVTADNQVVQRTITGKAIHPGYTAEPPYPDLAIYTLDQDLPSSIVPCKILPSNYAAYLGGLDPWRIPLLATDQQENAIVADFARINSPVVNGRVLWQAVFEAPHLPPFRSDFYQTGATGDSGNPVFLVLHDSLALVTVRTFTGTGTFVSPLIPDLNGMIASADAAAGISTGYQVRTVDLSAYAPFSNP